MAFGTGEVAIGCGGVGAAKGGAGVAVGSMAATGVTRSIGGGVVSNNSGGNCDVSAGGMMVRDGGLGGTMQFFYYSPELGPEFIKKFFATMEIQYSRNFRQMTDWLAQGRYAICFGCKDSLRAKNQGLPVDDFDTTRWKEGSSFSSGGGALSLPNQAPHPNAAKVFINWFLSRRGQIALQKLGDVDDPPNSRRIDIPKDDVPPTNRMVPDAKYFDVVKPEYADQKPIADLAKEIMAAVEARK